MFSLGSAYLLYGTPEIGWEAMVVWLAQTCSSTSAVVRDEPRSRPTRILRRLRAVAEGRQPTQLHGWVIVDDANSGRTLFAPIWTNVILEGTETFATLLDGAILRDGVF